MICDFDYLQCELLYNLFDVVEHGRTCNVMLDGRRIHLDIVLQQILNDVSFKTHRIPRMLQCLAQLLEATATESQYYLYTTAYICHKILSRSHDPKKFVGTQTADELYTSFARKRSQALSMDQFYLKRAEGLIADICNILEGRDSRRT